MTVTVKFSECLESMFSDVTMFQQYHR